MDRSASTQNVIRFLRDPHISCRLTFPTCYPCTSHTYAMRTSWDAAVLGHEQQSSTAACSAAVRFAGAEATFPQFDSHVGMCPYGNTLYSMGLSESGWTKSLLRVWCPRGARPKKGENLYSLVQMCVLSAERGRVRWGLQYSSSHRFSGPAWGCGKCQPLIELIKPFWVSDVNMVSTTKGHCIKQLPLGGPWGIKGLLVSRTALVCRWKQVKANDRRANTE